MEPLPWRGLLERGGLPDRGLLLLLLLWHAETLRRRAWRPLWTLLLLNLRLSTLMLKVVLI